MNPLTNSYSRFGEFEAPKFITWSPQNRQQLMRIPKNLAGDCRLELRSPDGGANPYLVFALMIYAGIDGIKNKMILGEPVNVTYKEDIEGLECLPQNLETAVNYAKDSDFSEKMFYLKIFCLPILKIRKLNMTNMSRRELRSNMNAICISALYNKIYH